MGRRDARGAGKEESMIKIDKDIKPPKHVTDGTRRRKYPFREMKPGDSFFIEGASSSSVCSSSMSIYRVKGWKFGTAKEDGGLRVWRLK